MKFYTDLEQSKTLAKILNEETADLWWDTNEFKPRLEKHYHEYLSATIDPIPCWSLAALLSVIPKEVKIKGQRYAPCLFPISNGYWLYRLWYNSNEIIEPPISVYCDSLIDACYEMIIKLKENNLI